MQDILAPPPDLVGLRIDDVLTSILDGRECEPSSPSSFIHLRPPSTLSSPLKIDLAHSSVPQQIHTARHPRSIPQMASSQNAAAATTTTAAAHQQRIADLLAQQNAIQDELARLQTAPTTVHQPSVSRRAPHRHRVARSQSSSGTTIQPKDALPPVSRTRTLSQQSAPLMTRTSSKDSTSSQTLPFTQTGPMPPPLQLPTTTTTATNPTMLDAWQRDPPYHPFSPMRRSPSQRISDLEQVPELEHVGETPADFLARTAFGSTPISAMPLTPLRRHRLSTSSRHSQNLTMPPTPTTTTLTEATTSMSRQNSLCNEPLLESMQMMKFDSQTSYSSDMLNVDSHYHVSPTKPSTSHCSSDEERSQLLRSVGAGPNSYVSSPCLPVAHSYPPFHFVDACGGEKMEPCQSSESSSSTSSSRSRNKQRLQVSNQAAARPLMPKAGCADDEAMSRDPSSQSMGRLASSRDGVPDKMAISKPAYQRPRHERVYCKSCDEHPEGFRGEHELRRHHDRQHKAMVKKWVCVEPVSGLTQAKPVLPLSRCKSCTILKKKYGAYYNAAAHLRRAHFKPKAKGRSKSSKLEDSQKRGGKGGGDWPPMHELKQWMKLVEEPATDYSVSATQQQAVDESDDEDCEMDGASDEANYTLDAAINVENFDASPSFDTSAMLDLFVTPSDMTYDGFPSTDLMSQPQYHDLYQLSHEPFKSTKVLEALQDGLDPILSYSQQYADSATHNNPTITPNLISQNLLDDPFYGLEAPYSTYT